MVEFQLLPFSTCTTRAGNIGGGGVMFGGMDDEEEVVEVDTPSGIGQAGGGEQQPPQLVQARGAATLFARPYGFMSLTLWVCPRSTQAQNPYRTH